MSDRFKMTIEPYSEGRVLVYDSDGLAPDVINQINDLCLKEEWRDVYFATLDDGRVGLVCKPTIFVKLMGWRNKKYGKKYPVNLKKEFMRAANEALRHGKKIEEYKEELTKDEKELEKHLEEAVHEVREEKGPEPEEGAEGEVLWDQEK